VASLAASLALSAFAWLPLGHQIREPAPVYAFARPWFVADISSLVETSRQSPSPVETAATVLDSAGKRIYVALHDGRVLCRLGGRTLWTWSAGEAVLAGPLLDEATQTLFVAAGDGTLAALNRFTGAVRWQVALHEELTTTPTLAEGRLFVMSSEESVTAVDAATGKSLWKYHRDRPAGFTIRGNARPAAAHGLLFAGFADGMVAALRAADGVPRWTRNVGGAGDYLDVDALAAPADDRRVYAASARAGVFALDAASGEVAWTRELPGANRLLVEGTRVYAGGRGAVVALSRRGGAQLWRAQLPKERFATQPVLARGLLLFSEERGPLVGLEPATGRPLGVLDPGSGFSQPPTVAPGAAFVLSNAGRLFSLGLFP
jgi:outer membrane protein assembly factor BamB